MKLVGVTSIHTKDISTRMLLHTQAASITLSSKRHPHSQKLTRQPHQPTTALPLALHVHLQRHLARLLHGALLARAATDPPRRALLLKQLAGLAHGQADELALRRAPAGAGAVAADEHLHGLQGRRVAHARRVGFGAVIFAAEILLVVRDGGCGWVGVSIRFGFPLRSSFSWSGGHCVERRRCVQTA